MPREIIIKPQNCIGCSTCALTCSLTNDGIFDLQKARIKIYRDDFSGTFELRFSSTCTGCKQCARVCPAGALALRELAAENQPTNGEVG